MTGSLILVRWSDQALEVTGWGLVALLTAAVVTLVLLVVTS